MFECNRCSFTTGGKNTSTAGLPGAADFNVKKIDFPEDPPRGKWQRTGVGGGEGVGGAAVTYFRCAVRVLWRGKGSEGVENVLRRQCCRQ